MLFCGDVSAGLWKFLVGAVGIELVSLLYKGRPSIPPEQLLRALSLQMLYTVRSERLLIEEIDYNILFRWFVAFGMLPAALFALLPHSPSERSRPAADATREVRERWLPNG